MRVESNTDRQLNHQRAAGILLLLGVVLYIVPSAVVITSPFDDAATTLAHVADNAWWIAAHIAQLAAVVLWAAAVVLLRSAHILAPGRGAVAVVVWSMTGAAMTISMGMQAFGLPMIADWLPTEDAAGMLEGTDVLLLTLNSVDLVTQALMGAAVALFGLALLRREALLQVLGWLVIVSGTGSLVGSLLVNAAIRVPFTIFVLLSVTILALTLLPRTSPRYRPGTKAATVHR